VADRWGSYFTGIIITLAHNGGPLKPIFQKIMPVLPGHFRQTAQS